MRHLFRMTWGSIIAGALIAASVSAKSSAPTATAPKYVTIPLEVTVNRPAKQVWKRVGKFCDVSEWLPIKLPPCTIVSGQDNEIGAVRSVGMEVLVGKSAMSYTYAAAPKAGVRYNMYHGTVEVRSVTESISKILYTLILDNSMLPDDAARERENELRTAIKGALANMKTLAEGGAIPPQAPPTRTSR